MRVQLGAWRRSFQPLKEYFAIFTQKTHIIFAHFLIERDVHPYLQASAVTIDNTNTEYKNKSVAEARCLKAEV